MIRQETLSNVIDRQTKHFNGRKNDVERESLPMVKQIGGFATVITGLRRVGKSTLLGQLAHHAGYAHTLYLNFDDINLSGFAADDFTRLLAEIESRGAHELFFDEIQTVQGWEVFVHQLLREEYVVFVSGSNASMLSINLGTHLTGRHLPFELLPFSYTEYLSCRKVQPNASTFGKYLCTGGMPEYVRTGEPLIVQRLLDDVLVRDIAVNQGIRNVDSLRKTAAYLFTNVARPYSSGTLRDVAGVSSTTTVIDYLAAMRNAYLLDFVPLYSDSLKAQSRNAKKVYAYDHGMAHAVSLSRSPDTGRLLENFVYVQLRRTNPANRLFYFQQRAECDFIVTDTANRPIQAVQVCHTLNSDNFSRELTGLRQAMSALSLRKGLLVTNNESDHFTVEEGEVEVVRAWEWAGQKTVSPDSEH